MNTKDSAMILYVYIRKWVYRSKGKGVPLYAMKLCGEVEVELNSILKSDLCKWQI